MSYLSILSNNYAFNNINSFTLNQLAERSAKDLLHNPCATIATISSMLVPIISGAYFLNHKNKKFGICSFLLAASSTALMTYHFALHFDHQIFNHITNIVLSSFSIIAFFGKSAQPERAFDSALEKLAKYKQKILDKIINELPSHESGMAA